MTWGLQTLLLTGLAMVAFAANSVLCRLALADPLIDPVGFTLIRLVAGAVMLGVLVRIQAGVGPFRLLMGDTARGSWLSAFALFAYAAGFSFAYLSLDAGMGALILFGVVQATMIGVGFWQGERLEGLRLLGALAAMAGLVYLLSPGADAPSAAGAGLMALAGVAWGVYSLRGRLRPDRPADPTLVTAGNFLRAVPMGLVLAVVFAPSLAISTPGVIYAVASGALASGAGYAVWYTALRGLAASEAAIVQLTVPAIAAAGGVLFLGESLGPRLILASMAILGGVALVLALKPKKEVA